ncbi:hypothetical protein [Streptomyces litchfieldiae]|uniref:Uncharacterized protein n=1 Tax=Streptomyces litchfieldiae TaxID=3075543 RepID=A0ABU2MWJ4_9ACTN|nr:hypothetical protein [Streptomyces sp. DSM 44938]MDT0346023.1 hypothetical protein [Streptomyces sp. DSM 44938]
MSTATVARDPRHLLSSEEFAAVAATVLDNNPGMRPGVASRIVAQGLAYVATAGDTEMPLAPSRVVDEGWHALISPHVPLPVQAPGNIRAPCA